MVKRNTRNQNELFLNQKQGDKAISHETCNIEEEQYESDIEGEILQQESSDSSEDESEDDDSSQKAVKWIKRTRSIKIKPFEGPHPGPAVSLSCSATPNQYFYQTFQKTYSN